jgi:hypothetical protein
VVEIFPQSGGEPMTWREFNAVGRSLIEEKTCITSDAGPTPPVAMTLWRWPGALPAGSAAIAAAASPVCCEEHVAALRSSCGCPEEKSAKLASLDAAANAAEEWEKTAKPFLVLRGSMPVSAEEIAHSRAFFERI